ncbi:hypothetical protein [Nocardioides luteus]|uniref:hypothetical protein n=1 Tax=Nocardioides luteus TaxID=1844 RepID=UPI0018CAAA96|nr:hypothetical protein [Nocardioides luteus]MBG6098976.1 hypothetical protein [Nocardioides luteus]
MRQAKEVSIRVSRDAGEVFEAAVGVVQGAKGRQILAVHNEGRKLVVREKPKFSNPKFVLVGVTADGAGSQMHVVVGADPRTPSALLDGTMNDRALKKFVEAVQAALDGSAPAPASPVTNHYLKKKTQVPWLDPNQEPEIELGGNLLAVYGL